MGNKQSKELVGTVVSDVMNKSRVVKVTRRIKHPLYEKVLTRSSRFMMHDEKNETKVGDSVRMKYVRPLSKKKNWMLVAVVAKAE